METNTILITSLITLFFLLYLLVRKKLNTIVKSIYLFTIFAMIAVSFLLINRNDFEAIVHATEVATQNTRKALLSVKEETNLLKESVLLDAPIINQLPDLPRGCEVTSLAMLLQYADIDVDKMTLAKQIKKDTTPYSRENGKIYYGNPNDGFIGDMYSLSGPGLGVYHKPIAALAEKYLPGSIIDFTGSDFEEIKNHLSNNRPVWVITNSTFKKLPDSEFRTWHTPSGTVKITYSEHSVLITGYDETYIYFNDPLTGEKNKKAPITDFEESWVQMGSQAITINS
ncbi:C39 family peptidase [Niallia sp. RD1]|uniref:C39 family peptidase n=1 Tax=Niallia sp. RD1 TaxID=2962858 RepID=UPI0020C19ED2|nr:C39 family peptidase [Niallia sp. RD1]UTI42194.1 C39 family peptidase [Niallia sp. RD1]